MNDPEYIALIGTNSVRNSQGIYTVHLERGTLKASVVSTQSAYNTGALALSADGRRLYAASEGMVFQGQASGGALAFSVDGRGTLTYRNGVPTQGQRPCCLALDPEERNLYAANFFGGSLAMLPVAEDGSLRPARRVVREPKPRGWLHGMHSVGVLDGGALVGAVSLSQSEFVVYRADDGSRAAAYGFGERVYARSFDSFGAWIYVMLQDPGDIYVLRNRCAEGLGLECVQVISVLPEPRELYGTSAIRVSPDGKLLIAAVRRTNSLTLFRIGGDGRLTRSDVVELPGLTPRDLQISPDSRVVVTALQASDEICVHEIDRERGSLVLRDSGLHIPSPASVAIRKEARP